MIQEKLETIWKSVEWLHTLLFIIAVVSSFIQKSKAWIPAITKSKLAGEILVAVLFILAPFAWLFMFYSVHVFHYEPDLMDIILVTSTVAGFIYSIYLLVKTP